MHCAEFARAVPCLESAVRQALPEEKISLQVGLTKALFMTGDLQRAELAGRAVLEHGTRLPELLAIVARARIGLGKTDEQTTAYLDEAMTLSPGSDVKDMIDLGYEEAKTGKQLDQSGGDKGQTGTKMSAQKSAERRRRKGK
ncbi:MAG: hypothetical protein GY762_02880 [Proteobacteria bacterium]|nr:hypothetical protein [Pseudomonadota bacterium]